MSTNIQTSEPFTKDYLIKKYDIVEPSFIKNMSLSEDGKHWGVLTNDIFYINPYIMKTTIGVSRRATSTDLKDNSEIFQQIKAVEQKYGWEKVKRKKTWKDKCQEHMKKEREYDRIQQMKEKEWEISRMKKKRKKKNDVKKQVVKVVTEEKEQVIDL